MPITYVNGDLFLAPEGSILVHATNCQGEWRSGIAKEFKQRFPKSFEEYNKHSVTRQYKNIPALICKPENNYRVGCLFTSENESDNPDEEWRILRNTDIAIEEFITQYGRLYDKKPKIYSNRFNSGLFRVPWEKTEEIVKKYVDRYNLDWTVCIV